jgi:hypothetical protein
MSMQPSTPMILKRLAIYVIMIIVSLYCIIYFIRLFDFILFIIMPDIWSKIYNFL